MRALSYTQIHIKKKNSNRSDLLLYFSSFTRFHGKFSNAHSRPSAYIPVVKISIDLGFIRLVMTIYY